MSAPLSILDRIAPRPHGVPDNATPGYGGAWRWAALSSEPVPVRRYLLGRWWAPGPRALWVMLNPSTADASVDDPTIRKCRGFCERWGYGSFEVVNLWSYRATDPKALAAAGWPLTMDDDAAIIEPFQRAAVVIAAWGAHASKRPHRPARVRDMLSYHANVVCLGYTADRQPRHPLMLAYSTEREAFR